MFNLPNGIHWHNTDEFGNIIFIANHEKIANEFTRLLNIERVDSVLISKDNPRNELRVIGGIEYSEFWKCYIIRVHGSKVFKKI